MLCLTQGLKLNRAMGHMACEMVWLKILLMELNFKQPGPMPMYCDNQSTIYIT